LFRHASAKLDEETDQVIINKRAAEERVAMFIQNLSDRLKKRGFSPVDFNLTLTRQEIGNFLGLALETVSRTLRNLEDAGLITVHHKHIRILDLKTLRDTYACR
jgi:CRP/FNR family transcriptional regulator